MRRSILPIVIVLAVSALLAACSSAEAPPPHPAATVVTELLELRRDDVRDADAYAPYFEDVAMAEALASASTVPTGTPRVPPYEAPYLSAESSSTAEVVVVWEPDGEFLEWVPVTIFHTRLAEGRWRVVDAVESTTAPEPFAPEAD